MRDIVTATCGPISGRVAEITAISEDTADNPAAPIVTSGAGSGNVKSSVTQGAIFWIGPN